MERCFIVKKESEYYKDLEGYYKLENQQKKFINKFFKEKDIEAESYRVGGNGCINQPFNEYGKKDIKLEIIPTDKDLINFSKILCKSNRYGLCAFKKNSSISKEFAQRCIDEQVVINLYSPRISDYFVSLGNGIYGCGYQTFKYKDILYIKVSSDYLKDEDTPKGFKEIRLSEYYKIKEETEA